MKYAANTHLILGMLLHCLGKLKIQMFGCYDDATGKLKIVFLRNSVYILIYADHSTVVHVFSSLPQTRNVQKHIMQHIIVHCVKTKCKIGLNKHNRCTNYSTSTISGP